MWSSLFVSIAFLAILGSLQEHFNTIKCIIHFSQNLSYSWNFIFNLQSVGISWGSGVLAKVQKEGSLTSRLCLAVVDGKGDQG